MIEKGKKVKLNFTLHADGELVESTKEQPFEYVHGQDNILPGLVNGLEGMKENEEKTIVLAPENAYGEIMKEAFHEVPRDAVPKELNAQVGMTLQLQTKAGEKKLATIAAIKDDTIVLNFNHPLAGKTLTFKIQIVEII